jgi:hypothetical protein
MSGSADPDTRRTGGAIKRRVRRGQPSAGRQLQASLDAALAAYRELGAWLDFSETELLAIDPAAAAADRGEQLQELYEQRLRAGASRACW